VEKEKYREVSDTKNNEDGANRKEADLDCFTVK
jgi:hypothetical protein